MSIITYPGTRVASFRWRKVNQAITNSGPFGGTQSLESGAPVWAADLTGVSEDRVTARRFEVFVESLDGFRNQLELWNMENPVPLGTLRGNGAPFALAANVAQGATSMQLVAGTSNAITNIGSIGSFWTATQNSADVIAPDGTAIGVWKFVATATPSVLFWRSSGLSLPAGIRTGSVYVYVPTGQAGVTSFRLGCDWQDVDTGTTQTSTLFGQWVRLTSTATLAATRTFVDFNLSVNATTPVAGFTFYAAFPKDELASVATDYGFGKTLLKGDLLGIGSGLTQQVVRIPDDAISTGQGNITVNIGTPLRNAFTAGTEVRFDKPKALFRQRTLYEGNEYTADGAKPWMLSLVEDWRP